MLIPNRNIFLYDEDPKGKLTVKKFLKELNYRLAHDGIELMAANLSYYFVLSLFPMLVIISSISPYINVSDRFLLNKIRDLLPIEFASYVEKMVTQILNEDSSILLTIGIIFTLWVASNAINGIIYAFNVAFRVELEKNKFIVRMISVIYTIIFLIFILVIFWLIYSGRNIVHKLLEFIGINVMTYNIFIVPIFILFSIFSLIYYIAPSVKLKPISFFPGLIFSLVTWIVASRIFGYYMGHFSSYLTTYGSAGIFLIFVILLYITAYILILGAEINAILHSYKVEPRIYEKTFEKTN